MGDIRLLFVVLGLWCWQVAAQNETLSIDIVSSQIDDFLQLIQNGSLDARSLLPSGCALTVSIFNLRGGWS